MVITLIWSQLTIKKSDKIIISIQTRFVEKFLLSWE
jgi:hypothetical protein